jgi:hypothetical protein
MNPNEWKLIDRFKEPSSWAGIGVLLSTIGVNVPSGLVQAISLLGAGACVLLSVLLKEGKQS